MPSEHIRVTMHSTLQKIGRRPDPKVPALSDQLRDPDLPSEATANHIKVIGSALNVCTGTGASRRADSS